MAWWDTHLSDEQLILDADGELAPRESRRVREHLAACWSCRARRQEIENAIAEFVRAQARSFEGKLPPADGPGSLLRARLAELASLPAPTRSWWPARAWVLAGAAMSVLALALFFVERNPSGTGVAYAAVSVPKSDLTPGAAVFVSSREVCQEHGENNRAVPSALQRKVFEAYGIANAAPHAYEVDYLITPALGGADDIHNLWPHSYTAVWNAKVKDALEDRLRDLVCEGRLDLATAQRDISTDWIAAYKKYFHTDQPLEKTQ